MTEPSIYKCPNCGEHSRWVKGIDSESEFGGLILKGIAPFAGDAHSTVHALFCRQCGNKFRVKVNMGSVAEILSSEHMREPISEPETLSKPRAWWSVKEDRDESVFTRKIWNMQHEKKPPEPIKKSGEGEWL